MTPKEAAEAGINIHPMPAPTNPYMADSGDGTQSSDFTAAVRAAKRVYVGNLPYSVSENEIRQFFNNVMVACQGPDREAGDSVIGVYLNLQKRFAFVEFRSPIEATQALDLNGIQFRGESLKMGRAVNYNPAVLPEEFQPHNVPKLDVSKLGIVSDQVPNSPHKIFIGGIPYGLMDEQIRELLETFGKLRGLHMPKDPVTGMGKGYAFCEYQDHSVTHAAIKGLHGISIGDRSLTVRITESQNQQNDYNPLNALIRSGNIGASLGKSGGIQPTSVLCLLQMVTPQDLESNEDYGEIMEDIKEECANYGQVREVIIPRPKPDGTLPTGCGKVFVHFGDLETCKKAKDALQGRTFDGRTVLATFFDEGKFTRREFG